LSEKKKKILYTGNLVWEGAIPLPIKKKKKHPQLQPLVTNVLSPPCYTFRVESLGDCPVWKSTFVTDNSPLYEKKVAVDFVQAHLAGQPTASDL
jgi:hypothetical protein